MKPDLDTSPIIFDLESAPLLDARAYIDPPELEEVKAPANYKDPEKIADYIKEAKVKALQMFEDDITSKAALDWNVARIVALGWWTSGVKHVEVISNQLEEREALRKFWAAAQQRMFVGFKVREFDLPMLLQRSFYLDVPCARIDLGRYARGTQITDLFDWFTFNDLRRGQGVMRQTLKSVCRRLGIPVPDGIDGKQIPALVTAEDWDAVEAHCSADIDLTVALAMRCGVIRKPEPTVAEMVETIRNRRDQAPVAVVSEF